MNSDQQPLSIQVTRNDERGRYEAIVDGQIAGFADFHSSGDQVVFPHTVTDSAFAGRGVASALVRYSLDEVRSRPGVSVVPQCWFYAEWIAKHSEYADLLA